MPVAPPTLPPTSQPHTDPEHWEIKPLGWRSLFTDRLLWLAIAALLYVLLVGFLFNWLLFAIVGLWAVYRILRGWLALKDRRPLPV